MTEDDTFEYIKNYLYNHGYIVATVRFNMDLRSIAAVTFKILGLVHIEFSRTMYDYPPEHLATYALSVLYKRDNKGHVDLSEFEEWLKRPETIKINQKRFIENNKRLTGSCVGKYRDLSESAVRLIDMGLINEEQIQYAYITWGKRTTYKVFGICHNISQVIYLSPILDDERIPVEIMDFVLYHEILHLSQKRLNCRVHHDKAFRYEESKFPNSANIGYAQQKIYEAYRKKKSIDKINFDSILRRK